MTKAIKHILVPTDFSESGNNAIQIGIELSLKHDATLHVLHVVEDRYIITAPEPGIAVSVIANEVEQTAKTRLQKINDTILANHVIPVKTHLQSGVPYDQICKTADSLPIDLIVIGTHGTSGIREFFIGSTAYSVIKNTSIPVLANPSNFKRAEYKNILFPVRPISGIKEKFNFLAAFLKEQTSSIHIAALCQENEEKELPRNNEELSTIIEAINKAGLSCSREIYTCKNFASKVLELSEMMSVDLVAINATLDYKWTNFFIGPYAQQVVNHSKVPVLSYRENPD